MTDNEIIKAFSYCNDESGLCPDDCPLRYNNDCRSHLASCILDLIDRLKVENERLEQENHHFADIGKMYSEVKTEAIKEFVKRLEAHQTSVCSGHGMSSEMVYMGYVYIVMKEMVGEDK